MLRLGQANTDSLPMQSTPYTSDTLIDRLNWLASNFLNLGTTCIPQMLRLDLNLLLLQIPYANVSLPAVDEVCSNQRVLVRSRTDVDFYGWICGGE